MEASTNPMLDCYHDALAVPDSAEQSRADAIRKYGFAIPTEDALIQIERVSPRGVVEIGAGSGYWAQQLERRRVDVRAFDIEPAPSSANEWFAGIQPWHVVERSDHTVVAQFPDRTLLLIWPTKNGTWASAALEQYHASGGSCVVFVGELGAGRTGDEVFHAHLGNGERCLQCDYGVLTSPCICDIEHLWTRDVTVELPHWPGFDDNLHIYSRLHEGPKSKRRFLSRARRART